MKYKMAVPFMLAGVLLLSGCGTMEKTDGSEENEVTVTTEESSDDPVTVTVDQEVTDQTVSDNDEEDEGYFSDRDLSDEIDMSDAVSVILNGSSISSESDKVSISGSTITITEGGVYLLSGTLNNGSVIVNAGDEKVQLVLEGASINSDDFAAIYVQQADKVFITLKEGTDNSLSNGGSFTQIDDSNVDAVVFSKDDVTLNGSGSLTVTSPAGHGIVGKDEVTITNGTYEINSSGTSIKANDSIAIAAGTFQIVSGTDGLHAENNDDNSLGSIYIAGGTFDINAGDDGVHATTSLMIDGGTFAITAAEGLEGTYITINDGTISINASDDGINAASKSSLYSTPTVEINGGYITIVMGDGDTDGIDANGDIIINGGTVDVTGNSTFDYDNTGVINGGTVISNGEQITTLTNQMMGGHGGGMGGTNGGMDGGKGRMW